MKKVYLLCLLISLGIWGCKKDRVIPTDTNITQPDKNDVAALTSLKIEAKNNKGLTADIDCTIGSNDTITAVLPEINSSKTLVMSFAAKETGSTIKAGDVALTSGVTSTDYTKAVNYTVTSPKGNTKSYTVLIKVFTGLPIFSITTGGPIVSKDTYIKGNLTVNANLSFKQEQTSMSMQIKGHGNSTWVLKEFLKKPYRIKLDSKTSLLGMTAGKNWVLLANYDDKTLMRNYIAMQLARRLGSNYAPESRFVEVVVNGEFLGNYLLTPHVEFSSNSINDIDELSDKNTADADITGGYLLELDQKKDATNVFITKKNLPFAVQSPDPITTKQLAYITKYVQDTEDAIFSPGFADPNTGYAKYIDVDSFMNWYFANEVVLNNDARDWSSIYYYKKPNGKLGMGPVWDFDLSSGNINYTEAQNPTGIWFIRDATWMLRLAQDPAFILKVRKRWADIKGNQVKQLFTEIDQTAAYLQLSQKKNFEKWPILDKYVWPNVVWLGSYDKEVAYMKNFIQQRVNWMDTNMNSW